LYDELSKKEELKQPLDKTNQNYQTYGGDIYKYQPVRNQGGSSNGSQGTKM